MTWKRLSDDRRYLALVLSPMAIFLVLLAFLQWRGDPQTLAASEGNEGVEFARLRESQRVFRMVDHRNAGLAYLTLTNVPLEKLTAPVRLVNCEGFLPAWIPPYPKATRTACLELQTDLKEKRRLSSFLVDVRDARAVFEFYHEAFGKLNDFSELANGMLPAVPDPGSDEAFGEINAIVNFTDEKSRRQATIDYYRYIADPQAVVVIDFSAN